MLCGPYVINVNTKICKRLNDFDIVTRRGHIGAQWSSTRWLKTKEIGFKVLYLECQYNKRKHVSPPFSGSACSILHFQHPWQLQRECPMWTFTMSKGDNLVAAYEQQGLAVASIMWDDPSTLPGDDSFPRAHWTINSSVLVPACTATAMRGKLGSEFEY